MSHTDNTPNLGAGALQHVLQPQYVPFETSNGSTKPIYDPNSYEAVDEYCHGIRGWEGSELYKSTAIIGTYAGMCLFTVAPYLLAGIGLGSLFCAATFFLVATQFPMPALAQYTYWVLIACLLIASNWAKEVQS